MLPTIFSVAAEIGDRVGLLYKGYLVEEGPVGEVIKNPMHPYTKDLIDTIPFPTKRAIRVKRVILEDKETKGCPYYNRCYKRSHDCLSHLPELKRIGNSRLVRCINI